jgi:hypothetical protein
MLTFIDQRLLIIKQIHNQFMGDLDVIMKSGSIKHFHLNILEFSNQNYMGLIFLAQIVGINM